MKKSLILLSVYMLLVSSVIGQTTTVISGVICNASGKGIPDVNVYVSGLKQKYSVLASCLSDLNGSFSLSFKSTTDSISINASGLNIMNTTIVCENKSQYKQIIVDEKAQELGEVVIRAPKIYSKGDTISYFVRSFQSKNDMSIGQVLRRLPGIAVSDEGRISYKGQPIKKFYIEGLDLMKGRYGIATSNIDPNSISTIEILENHQDIKALEGLKPEERASINLKLKKGVKGVFNLIGSLGGGYGDGSYIVIDCCYTSCGVCIETLPKIQRLFDKYKGNDKIKLFVLFFKLKGESNSEIHQWLSEKGDYSFPVLYGDFKELDSCFKVIKFPTIIVIDPSGKIVFRGCYLEMVESYLKKIARKGYTPQ